MKCSYDYDAEFFMRLKKGKELRTVMVMVMKQAECAELSSLVCVN